MVNETAQSKLEEEEQADGLSYDFKRSWVEILRIVGKEYRKEVEDLDGGEVTRARLLERMVWTSGPIRILSLDASSDQ